MKRILSLIVLVFLSGTAAAAEQTDVMSAVKQFIAAFNKGDAKSAGAICTPEMSIIDEFPPHEWHGAGALAKWFEDYDADAKKNGITDGVVAIGAPRHVDVSGDRAYVVVPANYAYKKNGKRVKEIGSTFTVALQKVGADWRITGWSWGKR